MVAELHMQTMQVFFEKGKQKLKNVDTYRFITMQETPKVDIHFLENELSPTGLREPSLPFGDGAVLNAINTA